MINARWKIPSPLAGSNSHLQDSRVRAIIVRWRTGRFTRARVRLSAERTSVDKSVGVSIFAAILIENQPRRGRCTSSCSEHGKKWQGGRGRRQDAVKKREKWQETNGLDGGGGGGGGRGRRRRRRETHCLSLPTLQATVSDGSIEFVGLVALCELSPPPTILFFFRGYFYRATLASSYVKHRGRGSGTTFSTVRRVHQL